MEEGGLIVSVVILEAYHLLHLDGYTNEEKKWWLRWKIELGRERSTLIAGMRNPHGLEVSRLTRL